MTKTKTIIDCQYLITEALECIQLNQSQHRTITAYRHIRYRHNQRLKRSSILRHRPFPSLSHLHLPIPSQPFRLPKITHLLMLIFRNPKPTPEITMICPLKFELYLMTPIIFYNLIRVHVVARLAYKIIPCALQLRKTRS